MAGTDASDGLIAGLIAEYGRALRGYFRRATGGGDVADDLVQEVFVRVAAATYEPRGRERAWLFTIAHNVLVQHLRRQPRQTVVLHEGHEPAGAAHQDLRAALDQALQQLPDLDRHVFLLSELGGLTYAEIAASCNLSHASVRSRIFRARLALRERLLPPTSPQIGRRRSSTDDDR
jgi:RNA polymerase sigma-70 factor (ECF subfamily)